MEKSVAKILFWNQPFRTLYYFVLLNIGFWLVGGQRPLFILSLGLLLQNLRAGWKRIRGEVLIDPPDEEEWTTLESYQLKHQLLHVSRTLIRQYILLRKKSHLTFSILNCLIFIVIGKVGSYVYLQNLVFLIANGSFFLQPLYTVFPAFILREKEFRGNDIIGERRYLPNSSRTQKLIPDDSELWSPTPPPESLLPLDIEGKGSMPGHDEDSEEEFHFNPKHFDSSSSTSTSTSFEIL